MTSWKFPFAISTGAVSSKPAMTFSERIISIII